ncbi:Similar to chpt1: Cholinephosphotransferase 1 (Danio rerio) [Cotesia congregata]|uniref:Similar to chpt1: Cholinephosphotransferase 1 (Danio rerio) n=1 Tax=Cotesia congregata TaxID=51543 RepID=A0A8J2EDV9_COTCN|nr:Similar to chpt1: Cholinephosphotransferase 1 (Danio rerio) [Cotesia congregata]
MMMQFYKEKILSPGQLKRLSEHKYSCSSASLLDSYLQPWWDWLVSKVPLWLAPNLITIVGLVINIATTLILVYYSPDAKAEPPRWACFLCALGLFIYQSLDSIDGKQARRTGSSSPLGELFDHGCDSVSTGSLKFGKIDVTEAQFTIISIHLTSAIFGPEIWMTEVIPYLNGLQLKYLIGGVTTICALSSFNSMFTVIFTGGVGKNGSTVAILGMTSMSQLISGIFYCGFFLVFIDFVKSFSSGGIGKNGSTIALPLIGTELKVVSLWCTVGIAILLAQSSLSVILGGGVGKNGSTVAGTSVLSPIIPFSLVVVPAYIIYRKSADQVYQNHPALYILSFGMVAAKVTNRLVVAHMTKNEMEYLDTALIGPCMLFLNQYFNFYFDEYYVLWLCFIWVAFDFLKYSSQVCLEICNHLKIMLFRIPYSNNDSDKNGTNRLQRTKSTKKHH